MMISTTVVNLSGGWYLRGRYRADLYTASKLGRGRG